MTNDPQKDNLPSMPVFHCTQEELNDLPEYSRSMPTGLVVGKRWKRKEGTGWVIGEVVQVKSGIKEFVAIKWYSLMIEGT